jgi:hypothetical protein
MSRRCNICFCFPVKTRAKGESRIRQPGPSRELIRQVNRFQTAPSPPKRERERETGRERAQTAITRNSIAALISIQIGQ